MLRRIGVLASLAVVAAMFAGSSTAQAQTSGVCVFTGLVAPLTPSIPNAVPDAGDGNALDVEKGSYSYSSANGGGTATCAGSFNGAPVAPTPALIQSAGGYDNLVCGTGFAHDADGNATTINAGALQLGGPGDPAGYQIPFVAGVGPLLIGPNGAPNLGFVFTGPNAVDPAATITSNYVGAGLVEITPGSDTDPPTSRDNCVSPAGTTDGNTGAFQVKGFFVACRVSAACVSTSPPPCPPGQVGTPPACVSPNPAPCPPGQVGTPPACVSTGGNPPPAGQPSALCATQPGATTVPDLHALGQVDLWAWLSQPSSGQINVCVRAEAGTLIAGGRLEINANGSLGIGPHVDASSTDVSLSQCPQEIIEVGSIERIFTSSPGSNPIKVCVTLLGTSRRIEIGTTSSPASPFIRWVPDTDSLVQQPTQIP